MLQLKLVFSCISHFHLKRNKFIKIPIFNVSMETPLLEINLKKVKENYENFKKFFNNVFYAIKANYNPRILEFLSNSGCGVEICSYKEFKIARKFNFKRIVYNGFKSKEEIEDAINDVFLINVESIREYNIVNELGKNVLIGARMKLKDKSKLGIEPEEIKRCHVFAKEFYFYKDFNYDLDVVKPFDLNCDHFAVYDMDGEIQSMARIILRVPGYYCPFMYATIAGDSGSSHFKIPGNEQRIGEIMAIYAAGKRGILAFKQMMEYLTQYGTDIAHFDSVWTTYDEEDNYTGTYYKNKFFMQETGEILQYRDFGGRWKLIYTDKIKELKEVHHRIFQHKQG